MRTCSSMRSVSEAGTAPESRDLTRGVGAGCMADASKADQSQVRHELAPRPRACILVRVEKTSRKLLDFHTADPLCQDKCLVS